MNTEIKRKLVKLVDEAKAIDKKVIDEKIEQTDNKIYKRLRYQMGVCTRKQA